MFQNASCSVIGPGAFNPACDDRPMIADTRRIVCNDFSNPYFYFTECNDFIEDKTVALAAYCATDGADIGICSDLVNTSCLTNAGVFLPICAGEDFDFRREVLCGRAGADTEQCADTITRACITQDNPFSPACGDTYLANRQRVCAERGPSHNKACLDGELALVHCSVNPYAGLGCDALETMVIAALRESFCETNVGNLSCLEGLDVCQTNPFDQLCDGNFASTLARISACRTNTFPDGVTIASCAGG